MNKEKGFVKNNFLQMVKIVTIMFAISLIMVFIWSIIFYKIRFNDSVLMIGIGVIYVLTAFVGGLITGKLKGQRRFLWGMAVGFLYFAILCIISLAVSKNLINNGISAGICAICCIAGGTIGGMVS